MGEDKLDTILNILIVVFLISIGWLGSNIHTLTIQEGNYKEPGSYYTPSEKDLGQRCVDYILGFWFTGNQGNYICMNVNGSSIDDVEKTCIHETKHEIYYRNVRDSINGGEWDEDESERFARGVLG